MQKLLVAFGDSWTFGSELDIPREDPWPTHLANQLQAQVINLGTPASSIEHTLVQLFEYIKISANYADYKKIFMVGLTGTTRYLTYSNTLREFVNITPEANYRTGNIHESGRPPDVVKEFGTLSGEMYRMVESPEYNQYVATKTIFAFQQYCNQHHIDVLFFSYFDLANIDTNIVDVKTVYPRTITNALTGSEYELPAVRNHQYFAGKLFHPNIDGHQRIAELL
jgi:hypothetical protein